MSSSLFVVRDATEADLPSVLALVVELAVFEKEPNAVTGQLCFALLCARVVHRSNRARARSQTKATLADYKENFANKVFQTIVCEHEGVIVGMALFYLTFSTWKGFVRSFVASFRSFFRC